MRSVASAARAASSTASRRRRAGLADFEMDDRMPRRLARVGGAQHVHRDERRHQPAARRSARHRGLPTADGGRAARRLDDPPCRGRMAQQPVGRPDRPPHQFAAAIRAAPAEHALGAVAAERAFVRADARVAPSRAAGRGRSTRSSDAVRASPATLHPRVCQLLRPTCCPAVVPAILPNTDPDTSPVPPG